MSLEASVEPIFEQHKRKWTRGREPNRQWPVDLSSCPQRDRRSGRAPPGRRRAGREHRRPQAARGSPRRHTRILPRSARGIAARGHQLPASNTRGEELCVKENTCFGPAQRPERREHAAGPVGDDRLRPSARARPRKRALGARAHHHSSGDDAAEHRPRRAALLVSALIRRGGLILGIGSGDAPGHPRLAHRLAAGPSRPTHGLQAAEREHLWLPLRSASAFASASGRSPGRERTFSGSWGAVDFGFPTCSFGNRRAGRARTRSSPRIGGAGLVCLQGLRRRLRLSLDSFSRLYQWTGSPEHEGRAARAAATALITCTRIYSGGS